MIRPRCIKAAKNCEDICIFDSNTNKNTEEKFNNKACEVNKEWVKFDRAKLKIGSGRKDKEFCDILAFLDGPLIDIIHCKPLKEASSLNYLFSQAKFYGEAFLKDEILLS